jgi:DNA-binding MarR family transcriptional regulator
VLAHEVLRSIRRIVRRVSTYSRHLSAATGVTVPQLVCLKAVAELEEAEAEVTAAMVARKVQLSPATVSRVLDRLVASGLVERQRRSRDRRRVCLTLTDSGWERFENLPTPLQERFVERLLALGEDERQSLLLALRRITELMEAEDLDAAPMLTPGADFPAGDPH